MTKKIMVVDPGHEEGSRAAEVLCAVQDGDLVVQAVVDTNDISPNLNEDVILAQDNPSNPLLESTKAFKQQEILESGLQQRRDRDAAILKENHERMLSEKFMERLADGTFKQGITHYCCERESGKAWKRRIKKEQQRINHRDRRFRDRTRKLKKLLEYQIKSLEFVFQGPPFGDINPVITMDRRYNFPDVPNRAIEHIRNTAINFLGLE